MKQLARFVCRPSRSGLPDLMLGVFLDQQNNLKSNTVYEIREVLGELVIKEIGPSAIGDTNKNSDCGVSWMLSINDILSSKTGWALTKEELKTLNEKH